MSYRYTCAHCFIVCAAFVRPIRSQRDTVDFRNLIVFFGRDPGTLKSDIVSNKHPQLYNLFGFETLKLKFED